MAEHERKGRPKAKILATGIAMSALGGTSLAAVRGHISPSLAAGVLVGTIATTSVLAVAVVVIVSNDRLTRNLVLLLTTLLGRKPYHPVSPTWSGTRRRRRSLTRNLPGSRGRGDGWAL